MNNLGARNGEFVNVQDLVETDIFQMLMTRDRVVKTDFLKMCDEKSRELRKHFESSEA